MGQGSSCGIIAVAFIVPCSTGVVYETCIEGRFRSGVSTLLIRRIGFQVGQISSLQEGLSLGYKRFRTLVVADQTST